MLLLLLSFLPLENQSFVRFQSTVEEKAFFLPFMFLLKTRRYSWILSNEWDIYWIALKLLFKVFYLVYYLTCVFYFRHKTSMSKNMYNSYYLIVFYCFYQFVNLKVMYFGNYNKIINKYFRYAIYINKKISTFNSIWLIIQNTLNMIIKKHDKKENIIKCFACALNSFVLWIILCVPCV